jgi:hypothetical protein
MLSFCDVLRMFVSMKALLIEAFGVLSSSSDDRKVRTVHGHAQDNQGVFCPFQPFISSVDP